MKNLKKKILSKRIFWTVTLVQKSDGYYYMWTNKFLNREELVFAGYNLRALNNKQDSFFVVKRRLKYEE